MNIFQKLRQHLSMVRRTVKHIKMPGKPKFVLFLDVLYCHHILHCTYNEYLKYEFYKHKNSYRKQFLLLKHQEKRYDFVNPRDYPRSKQILYQWIQKGISRQILVAPKCGEDAFVDFFKKQQKILKKPDIGSRGVGISVLHYTDEQQAREYFRAITEDTLFEEYVIQHETMAAFNASSVNTLRIITLCKDNRFDIISAHFKSAGVAGEVVDNICNGGIAAMVDIPTGKISTHGFSFATMHKSQHSCHPVTGQEFIGTQIPHWEETLRLVEDLHRSIPNYVLFGWDVAITPTGPEIIEVNTNPDGRAQMIDQKPIGKLLLKYMKEARKAHK